MNLAAQGRAARTIQKVISLAGLVLFSRLWLGERLIWNAAPGFGPICLGVFLIFGKAGTPAQQDETPAVKLMVAFARASGNVAQ